MPGSVTQRVGLDTSFMEATWRHSWVDGFQHMGCTTKSITKVHHLVSISLCKDHPATPHAGIPYHGAHAGPSPTCTQEVFYRDTLVATALTLICKLALLP